MKICRKICAKHIWFPALSWVSARLLPVIDFFPFLFPFLPFFFCLFPSFNSLTCRIVLCFFLRAEFSPFTRFCELGRIYPPLQFEHNVKCGEKKEGQSNFWHIKFALLEYDVNNTKGESLYVTPSPPPLPSSPYPTLSCLYTQHPKETGFRRCTPTMEVLSCLWRVPQTTENFAPVQTTSASHPSTVYLSIHLSFNIYLSIDS